MRAQLTIDTDNSAFGDTREEAAIEVARILEATARKLRNDPEDYGRCFETLFDLNGNDVGRFGMKGPGDPGWDGKSLA